jgi:hypothetical protein
MRMSSPSTKKRRVCKSFEEKCAIITFVEENPSLKQKEIAEKYGIKPQTLSDILKNKDDFKMKAANSKFTQHLTKDRKLKYEEVDKALILWFRDRTSVPGVIIDGEVLRAKANEFAKLLYGGSTPHDAVKATWVDRFKKRYGIGKVTMSGDAAGVDPKNVDTWKNVELPQILHDYAPCDIYNFDETALFWKASPDKGLGFICTGSHHGVKQGKSRITILLGANMDGSDKPLPFVIGKFKNPRAFKNIRQLPVTYKSNCKAWMTATLFIEFMQKLNKHFRNQGRHVAVILDNCCAHRADELQQLTHVKIFFLPPNTTSVTQPMDAGIIKNFKVHYRRRLCIKRLYCIDTKTEYTWSLLDAVLACRAAWNAVTPTTISNCFGHVGFIQSIDAGTTAPESLEIEACGSGDSVMEIDPAFDNIWERLQQYFQLKVCILQLLL